MHNKTQTSPSKQNTPEAKVGEMQGGALRVNLQNVMQAQIKPMKVQTELQVQQKQDHSPVERPKKADELVNLQNFGTTLHKNPSQNQKLIEDIQKRERERLNPPPVKRPDNEENTLVTQQQASASPRRNAPEKGQLPPKAAAMLAARLAASPRKTDEEAQPMMQSTNALTFASQPSSIEKINVDVLAGELNAIQKNFQNPESHRHLPKGWTHLLEDGFNKKLIEKGSQEIVKLLPSISFPEEMFEDMNKEIKYREEAIKELERKKVNKATKILKPKHAAEKVVQRNATIERLNVQKSEIEDAIDVTKITSYISKGVEAAQDLAQKTKLDPNNLVAETFFQTQDFLERQYPNKKDLARIIENSKDVITNGNADLAKAFKALEVTRGQKDAAKNGVAKMVGKGLLRE